MFIGPKFLAVVLCFALSARVSSMAEDRVSWLRTNVVPLRTLDAADSDLSDLEPLGALFDNVEVVLLGEATRGDGTTFEAKARLVRFLHEQKGFDVLVFECGLFDCHRAWQAIRSGRDARSALDRVLFPLYVDSQQFQSLLDLVNRYARTDRPLEIAGIDSQLGSQSLNALIAGLTEALAGCPGRQRLLSAESLDEVWQITRHVAAGSYTSGQEALPTRAVRRRLDQTLDRMSELLACPGRTTTPDSSSHDRAFWQQVLANLRGAIKLTWKLDLWDPSDSMDPAIHNLRDGQMVDNLLWLKRHSYPGRKIIVWSLTLHLARDLAKLETGDSETQKRFSRFDLLGSRLAAALEPDPYVVAYTAFEGSKGSIFKQPHSLLVPTKGSLEDLLGRTGLKSAFLDLHRLSTLDGGHWLARPLIARPITFKELRGIWPRHLDAIFYIRTLDAVHPVSDE
jgi:erythromycin esterase